MDNSSEEITICRLCGVDKCGGSALSLYTNENMETTLVTKIKDITGNRHQISIDDGLPQNVCITCAENVERCYQLISSYVNTYHRLKALIFDKSEPFYDDDSIPYYEDDDVSMSDNADSIEEKELNESIIEEEKLNMPIIEKFSTLIRYRCKLCHKSYFVNEDFKTHRCTFEESSTNIICTACSETFVDNEELELHVVEKHKEANDLIGKNAYKCEICMKDFKTPLVYHLHRLDHNVCKYCDTILSNPKSSDTHNCVHWRNRKKLEKYECDQCDKKFPEDNMLKIHAKQVHNTICDICGQLCKDLKLHKMQHVIKNLNVSKVDLIEDKKKKMEILKKMRTCELCDASFKNPFNYQFHIQKHMSYFVSCEICTFKTASFKAYKKHQRIHPGISKCIK